MRSNLGLAQLGVAKSSQDSGARLLDVKIKISDDSHCVAFDSAGKLASMGGSAISLNQFFQLGKAAHQLLVFFGSHDDHARKKAARIFSLLHQHHYSTGWHTEFVERDFLRIAPRITGFPLGFGVDSLTIHRGLEMQRQ